MIQRIRKAPYSVIEGLGGGVFGALLVGSFILTGPIPVWLGYGIFAAFAVWGLVSRPSTITEEFRGKRVVYDGFIFGICISIAGTVTLWLILNAHLIYTAL